MADYFDKDKEKIDLELLKESNKIFYKNQEIEARERRSKQDAVLKRNSQSDLNRYRKEQLANDRKIKKEQLELSRERALVQQQTSLEQHKANIEARFHEMGMTQEHARDMSILFANLTEQGRQFEHARHLEILKIHHQYDKETIMRIYLDDLRRALLESKKEHRNLLQRIVEEQKMSNIKIKEERKIADIRVDEYERKRKIDIEIELEKQKKMRKDSYEAAGYIDKALNKEDENE